MKSLKYILAFLVVVAVLGQIREVRRLRQEVAALRAEVQAAGQKASVVATPPTPGAEFAAVAQGIERSEADRAEIEQLKADVAAMKGRAQELIRAAQASNPTAAVPNKLVPLSEWKNAGRDTPQAGIETALWAAAGGELDTLAGSLGFTASARQKADALFASMSEATRQQYGSPEKLLALMISKDAAAVSGMQVLGQKEITPDDVAMRVRMANEEGKTKDQNFLLHHANDGWRLTLTDDAVNKFAAQVKGK